MLWARCLDGTNTHPFDSEQRCIKVEEMTYYVVVHGGAGFHSVEDEEQVRKSLRRACTRALKRLRAGDSACVAVKESISELEDSECLNAGYGSNLTSKGTVECDAAIMDGSGSFGSVGALAGVKNPICAAKAVLDNSRIRDPMGRIAPLTLVSEGAHQFASSAHTPTVDPAMMISPRAQREWALWSERSRNDNIMQVTNLVEPGAMRVLQDTVGSISLDASNKFAAGVSSGGLLLKLPGRMGEAAVFGAGCWAQHSEEGIGVACSASGAGEAIMRASLAKSLGDALSRSPDDPHEEIRRILTTDICKCEAQSAKPYVGVIILTKELSENTSSPPRLWCAFNTASMAIAYASSHDSNPKSLLLRQDSSESHYPRGATSLCLTALPWTI